MNCNNVHEVFRYLVGRSADEPNLLNDYLQYFSRIQPFVRIARMFSPVLKTCYNPENKKFAFYTTRFNHVMEGLDGGSLLLFGKPQELHFALRNSISFFPVYDIIPELFSLFSSDPRLESSRAIKFIDSVTDQLVRINPEYLVLWNDSMFLERFLIFCSRRAGVKSICIQHGIFHDTFNYRLLDGHYADYMFVWGKSQADLYTGCGFDKDKLRIMGYPYRVDTHPEITSENVVCILGENIEITNKELGLKKKYVYEEIAKLLFSKNFKVVYKPHPFETDINYIPSNIEIISMNLNSAFNAYSKFIALTSTALLEATLHGKIAIQYFDDRFGGCDFSLNGFSYTARNLNEIPELLSSATIPAVIARDSLFVSHNPAQCFLDAVNSL